MSRLGECVCGSKFQERITGVEESRESPPVGEVAPRLALRRRVDSLPVSIGPPKRVGRPESPSRSDVSNSPSFSTLPITPTLTAVGTAYEPILLTRCLSDSPLRNCRVMGVDRLWSGGILHFELPLGG